MKKKIYLEFAFLFILFLYAIIVTKGYTIAWGLLPLFFAFYKNDGLILPSTIKDIKIGFLLFFIVFLLNLLFVYDFNNQELKLPHPDFHFYLKVASSFNNTGIENNLTAKNVLFSNLEIATQYRFFDTWLLSLLIFILPFSDLLVLQVVYMPILYFIVSFSIYRNIDFIKKEWIKILFSISFLFLFGDYLTNQIIFSSDNVGELCVVSYPKLAIFFSVFIYFFKKQLSEITNHDSILFLAFLPILIQVAFPIYGFIYLYIIIYYKYFLSNKKILFCIILSTLYYFGFYIYNSYLFKEIFDFQQFQFVKSIHEYLYRLLSITYNLVKFKLLYFIIIFLIFIFLSNYNKKRTYLKMVFISIGIMIPGILVYALFPSSPNSYQFMTNYTFPVVISVLFLVYIDYLSSMQKSYFMLNGVIVFSLALAGMYNQYNRNSFFGLQSANNTNFVKITRKILSTTKNPIGLTYWSEEFENKNKKRSHSESFNQHGTSFLVRLDGSYDVVCLSALDNKDSTFAVKLNRYYSAIAIFQRSEIIDDNNLKAKFYNKFKFEYLISDLPQKLLPYFIKKDVVNSTFDTESKVYFYKLVSNAK